MPPLSSALPDEVQAGVLNCLAGRQSNELDCKPRSRMELPKVVDIKLNPNRADYVLAFGVFGDSRSSLKLVFPAGT